VSGAAPDAAWRPGATIRTLRRRADLVERTRAFFRVRGVLEVDTPVLQGGANLDHGVVPFAVATGHAGSFLPTSPEHPLKRLLAAGSGDVWTLAPAFRRGELGQRHAPEFRMLEWYRCGWDDARLRDEVVALLDELTGFGGGLVTISWREAFRRHAGLDPLTCGLPGILDALGAQAEAVRGDRAAALDLLLTSAVEPHLGRGRWTALTDYPPEACAQARLRSGADGQQVAARFEIYRDGVELANGYHELTDANELQARLSAELAGRSAGEAHDARFAAAMTAGLPDCAGVAVGFDRVVMLALGLPDVAATQAFPWERR
jgi:lysyl-tRNA synthetase class 2